MKKVYKFHVDYGRHGSLSGTFVADDDAVAKALGKSVHFEEPWGKHSSCTAELAAEHFKVLTDDQDFITKLYEFGMAHHGDDPLGILADQEADARG